MTRSDRLSSKGELTHQNSCGDEKRWKREERSLRQDGKGRATKSEPEKGVWRGRRGEESRREGGRRNEKGIKRVGEVEEEKVCRV
jgi:hypothetical protein